MNPYAKAALKVIAAFGSFLTCAGFGEAIANKS